ncbi:MAG: 30S ribosomal protein S6 [Chloroflexaceae bacterium]|nr:30S ribosomal protein S6 [Chloroflexaceae bacterium]NJO04974.1 30S ribosomal protein S6 [Chloroflexaceae bacterium]NJO84070.1 30S ribosomal protein S6 [Blastochloris sp.]
MFIISPLHTDDDSIAALINRIQQSIEAESGEVTSVNYNAPWGRRRLAYPIRAYAGGEASRRNFTEGFYVLMHFTLHASKVTQVERTIKLTDPILRYLLTTIEQKAAFTGALDETQDDVEVAGDIDDIEEDDEEMVEEDAD